MATLIQSKQIQGIVTASVIEGDFRVSSGSVDLTTANGVTGSFSGSFVGDGTGLTINYSQLQGKPTFTAGTGIVITEVGSTITITNTGGGSGGGVSDAAAIAILNAYTASNDLIINGINLTTASLQSQINALVSATSSYLTTDNTGSDSQTLTIVGDQLTISGGNTITIPTGSGVGTSDFTQLTNVPSGLVSGSSQLEGFVSKSANFTTNEIIISDGTNSVVSTDLLTIDPNNKRVGVGTSSPLTKFHIAGDGTNEGQIRLQQANNGADGPDIAFYSSRGTIASPLSVQGGDAHGRLNAYTYNGTSFIQAGSFGWSGTDGTGNNTFDIRSRVSGTLAKRIEITSAGKVKFNDSYEFPTSDGSANQILQTDGNGVLSFSNLPSGLVSGSVLRTLDGTGVLSGSVLTDLSTSLDSRISVLESQTDNTGSDTQTLSIVGNQITISDGNTITIPTGSDLPSGIISSSQQISDLGYVTSSLEAPFNGDRVVSNTLLGELYSQSFNAGTTGSLAQFIEQVFFPSEAPTATFSTQTSNLNTNVTADGTVVETISISDTVDDSPYVVTLTGENAFRVVPTNADSSSWEIQSIARLSAGTFTYDITVTDANGASRTYSGRTLEIQQASAGTFSTNGTLYIIESATSGVITLSTSGRPGSTGGVSVSYSPNYGSQVATNFQSSNPLIAINSTNGQLSVGNPISGSGNLGGSTITSNITYNDQYGNEGSGSISVNVTQNNAPDIVFSNSSLLNTNQATGSSGTLVTISFTDTEGDAINHDSFTFTETSGQLQSTKSGNNYLVTATSDLSASNYTITCSVEDIHGFRTNTETHTFTIAQASSGTLTGDSSIYIIESAVSGDSFTDATGFGNGNLAQIGVSYSPNYGSQVATLSSSNPAIVVDGSGNLTLGVDLSGSVTQSGDSFTSLISWTDQYGNSDSSTITATVFGNQSPSANFTDNGLSDVTAVSGSNIGSLSITDTESNSPFVVTIGGTDGSKFGLVPQNAQSSSWIVQPNQSLTIGTYSVQFTVVDSYSEQAVLNETISVSSDSDFGKVYVYTSTRVAGGALDPSNYIAVMGAETVDSSTPPLVSTYSADTASPFKKIKEGSLGQSSITVSAGQLDLRQTVSGSNLNTIISSSFGEVGEARQILVIFPSGSDMTGTPTSMTDSLGGSTSGEYVMFVKGGGDTSFGSETSTIHGVELDSPHEGYSTWYIIGRTGTNADTSYEVQIIPSSGSAPT